MKKIDEGEPFNLTTDKQKNAAELVIKSVKRGQTDKGKIVEKLTEEIYDRKGTSQTFLKNMIKSCNHCLQSVNRFGLVLGDRKEVKV